MLPNGTRGILRVLLLQLQSSKYVVPSVCVCAPCVYLGAGRLDGQIKLYCARCLVYIYIVVHILWKLDGVARCAKEEVVFSRRSMACWVRGGGIVSM